MVLRAVFLSCILGLSLQTLAVSLEPAGDTDTADEPDLLQMLDFLKGKSNVAMISNLLKEYKVVKAFASAVMDICAPCNQVFTEAAKENVGMRILVKAAKGQTPDVRDLYDLATKGVGNMAGAYVESRKKNKKYQALSQIFVPHGAMFSSAPLIEKFLEGLTGKQFTIDQELVNGVNEGNVTVTLKNMAQVNLLELGATINKNLAMINKYCNGMLNPPLNFVSFLQGMENFDVSNLSKIKAINGGMNNDKYAVTGSKQTFMTDPDVVKMLQIQQKAVQAVKARSNDQTAAESLLLTGVDEAMRLASRLLKDAENGRKYPSV